MNTAIILTLILGVIGIFQGGLNRQMATYMGVVQAVFLGNIITTAIAFIVFLWVRHYPSLFPAFFHIRSSLLDLKWWYVFPGIFGFFIVAGLPFVIYKIGAVKVTILLVVAQIVASVLWDLVVEKIPLNGLKVLGLSLACLSVILVYWKK